MKRPEIPLLFRYAVVLGLSCAAIRALLLFLVSALALLEPLFEFQSMSEALPTQALGISGTWYGVHLLGLIYSLLQAGLFLLLWRSFRRGEACFPGMYDSALLAGVLAALADHFFLDLTVSTILAPISAEAGAGVVLVYHSIVTSGSLLLTLSLGTALAFALGVGWVRRRTPKRFMILLLSCLILAILRSSLYYSLTTEVLVPAIRSGTTHDLQNYMNLWGASPLTPLIALIGYLILSPYLNFSRSVKATFKQRNNNDSYS